MMLSKTRMIPARAKVTLAILAFFWASSSFGEVIVFRNGSQLEVESYEVKSNLVVFTTTEGKVRSVSLILVDLEVTGQKNLAGVSLASTGSGESSKNEPLSIDKATKVQELLESSAVKNLLYQLPTLMAAGMAQAEQLMLGNRMEVDERLRRALERNCQPKQVYEAVLADFSEQAEDTRLNSALAWLRSPLSRRMIELERSAKTPEGLRLLLGYANGLDEMPPARRLEKLQRLDEVIGLTEARVELRMQILRAVFEGFNQTVPHDRRISEEEMNKAIQKAQAQMRASLKNSSLVSLLFTYRSSSDTEIGNYLAHWESDEGLWLSRSSRDALHAGVVQGLAISLQSLRQQAIKMRN